MKRILYLINQINPPFLKPWSPFNNKLYFHITPFEDAYRESWMAKCTPMSCDELDKALSKAGLVNLASPNYLIDKALNSKP